MFEESEVKENRRPPSFWLKIVIVVAGAMIVINAFRVNPPEEKMNRPAPVVEDKKGPLVQEPVTVAANSFEAFRMSFPYSSALKGSFRVLEEGNLVLVLVLDEANYTKYRAGGKFTSLVSTGRNPSGKIDRKLEAGTYFLVFNNRGGAEPQIVDANFAVE